MRVHTSCCRPILALHPPPDAGPSTHSVRAAAPCCPSNHFNHRTYLRFRFCSVFVVDKKVPVVLTALVSSL